MRRKLFCAAAKAAAVQRKAIVPSFQCFTRRVRSRMHEWLLSIKLVVPRQRLNEDGRPRRLIVKSSCSPSRRDAAALGQSCPSQEAYCLSFAVPSSASSLKAARRVAFA